MAVYDNYVSSQILANRIPPTYEGAGAEEITIISSFETTAAHDAASIYRVARNVPSTLIPLKIAVWTDGVTGMNDCNLGMYKTDLGDAVSAEALADTIDLSSAVTKATAEAGYGNGLNNMTNDNYLKPLWELAGETFGDHESGYDIGLASVANLSEADRVIVEMKFIRF